MLRSPDLQGLGACSVCSRETERAWAEGYKGRWQSVEVHTAVPAPERQRPEEQEFKVILRYLTRQQPEITYMYCGVVWGVV